MDIRTRPKRKKRVLTEEYDSYTFYLPVAKTERMRQAAEQQGQSYSDAMEEAMDLYLAVKIHILDMHTNGAAAGRSTQHGESR